VPKLEKEHLDIDLSRSTCTTCHNPHFGRDARLLAATVHAPFDAGKCAACHVAEKGTQP
jgi:Doubled CXXCH motif (Paired_CXXCH_1)